MRKVNTNFRDLIKNVLNKIVNKVNDIPKNRRDKFLIDIENSVLKDFEKLKAKIRKEDLNGDQEWFNNAYALFHGFSEFGKEFEKRKNTYGGHGIKEEDTIDTTIDKLGDVIERVNVLR